MRVRTGRALRALLVLGALAVVLSMWAALGGPGLGDYGAASGLSPHVIGPHEPHHVGPARTFRPHSASYPDPILRPGVLGNSEPGGLEDPGDPGGPGEAGDAVRVGSEHHDAVQAAVREYGFNMVASDQISLDRSISDLRHEECKFWHYDETLPKASVIVVFHNEGWSTLLRTLHSIIRRTPTHSLAEIVLIDDASTKSHLGLQLENYITRWAGIVRLFRNARREGLIQSRSIGARHATWGEVLVYLDAHCEVGINWYTPLVTPIAKNRKTCTAPLIDYIDGNDFTMESQQGGDEDGFARGAWDWSLLWKRIPLNEREKSTRAHCTMPYRSPAMAGGLFAIDREFFFELGLYDPGLQIWGGENFELSFKIWQCGGTLLFVPCSRVGHIYRLDGWVGNPPPLHVGSQPTLVNYVRVVEVWWDEYKDYFYASRPETRSLDPGDLAPLHRFRREYRCKSFRWFMENVAYDVPLHYPLPPKNVDWGEVRGKGTSSCLDSMGRKDGGEVELGICHGMGGNQLFRFNEAQQLMQYDQCLTHSTDGRSVIVMHCNSSQYGHWQRNGHLFVQPSLGNCLDRTEDSGKLLLTACQAEAPSQQWEMNHVSGL